MNRIISKIIIFTLFISLICGVTTSYAVGVAFVSTGNMSTGRYAHTATLLSNGKVLIAGGGYDGDYFSSSLSSAEIYDPSTGSFTATGSMSTGRANHTATLLSNGKVLIAGGGGLSSAEIYDPFTGSFTATGSMSTGRNAHTATLLSNGKVLVAGNFWSSSLSSAEIYDQPTGSFTTTGSMSTGRSFHTATLLSNGKVLIAGGNGSLSSSAEIYDPFTGSFAATGSMSTDRHSHTATLLTNGKVLIAGGSTGSSILSSAEIYDPSTGSFTATGSMSTGRYIHTATVLSNGTVLIAGGYGSSGYGSSSAELGVSGLDVRFQVNGNVGTFSGITSQVVPYGGSTSTVTAVPSTGYHFVNWTGTGGFVTTTANPLTVANVTADQTITANFETKPVVSAFTLPAQYPGLTVPVSSFTATDNLGVAGYLITATSSTPPATDSGWSAAAPATFTFASNTTSGSYTLYAWAMDQAGNISTSVSASVTLGCAVTATSDDNGSITLPGTSNYNCSQNRLYKISPKPGYKIADVQVDSSTVGKVSSYLFIGMSTLGTHTIAASFAPDGNANWSGISAGNNHSAAIRSDGTLWSWGTNDVGQVGDGSQTNRTNPVQVGNKTIWDQVSTGNRFTLGHRSDGTLWTWGDNSYGQLGDGTSIGKIIPQQVGALTSWSSVAAGGLTDNYPIGAPNPPFPGHSAALMSDGSLQSWGYNLYGEVGNNSTTNATVPVAIGTAGVQYVDISTGANHTVALRADGTLWAWGRNNWGQLGVASQVDKKVPVQIGTAADWIAIAAGYEHTLAIRNDGSLWGWGHNDQGQLGVETPAFSTSPILIDNSAIYTAIATGGYHSLAVRNNGTLWAFGRNLEGQLGDGTGATKSYPVQVGFDSDWADIEAGEYHTLALKSNGTMWSWGGNAGGQLGDTTTADRQSPVMIGTNTNNFLIRSFATTGGNITPLGNVTVSAGTSKAFTIAPLVGYQISDVKIDGVSQGAISSYTFTNTTGNHTISAIFTSIAGSTYTITALAGTGGSITPPGTITINSGSSQSFTIVPLGGYIISNVTVDGASQGAISSYTFSNITANHTISATFDISSDTTLPTISAFSIPASSNSLSVSVNLIASDNSGAISSYCLTETNNSASCIWTAQKPTTYSFSTSGSKTLYAFVKDPSGNISLPSSAAGVITITITNGACGAANTQTFTVAPTTNLCSPDAAVTLTATASGWSWTCTGTNGGTNASCSANLQAPCGPRHWTALPGGASPSIMHLAGNLTINGRAANTCDEIAAYDSTGTIVGYFYVQANGLYGDMVVNGDSSSTGAVDEGAAAGEKLTIRVWDGTARQEYSTPSVLQITPQQGVSGYVNYQGPLTFTAGSMILMDVVVQPGIPMILKAGWNLLGWTTKQGFFEGTTAPLPSEQISGALMSSVGNKLISDVFGTMGFAANDTLVAVGPDGVVYTPGSPFNTLKKLLPGKGYWVYVPNDKTITVPGSSLAATDQLPLTQGWTQIGFWGTDGAPPATGFACISGKFDVVVDETGKVYVTGSPFNTLKNLQKNKGYFIHTTAPATLTYQCP